MSSGSGGGGGATILIQSIMPLPRVGFVTAGHRQSDVGTMETS